MFVAGPVDHYYVRHPLAVQVLLFFWFWHRYAHRK